MRIGFLMGLAALFCSVALAQTPGSCALGRAQAVLDANDVQATLLNTGTLFYGPGVENAYYVPKEERKSPIYAASLWVGGRVNGEVRTAGTTYGERTPVHDAYEFWPGPLDAGATLPNTTDCSAYDRIWTLSAEELADYERYGRTTADLREWPVGLGAPAVDASGDPLVPTHRGQQIDLRAGERPVVYGSQTAFWVMNDVGNEHRTTGSDPLGIEVAVMAYAVAVGDPPFHRRAFGQATFYRYTITNRNSQPIEDAYAGLFADVDLGHAGDDYTGVDTTRALTYGYNADESDEGSQGYGSPPPAVGIDLLTGQAAGGRIPKCCSYIPFTAAGYYHRLQGLFPDGTPVREGGRTGDGPEATGPVTTYVFPGDPVTGQFWSAENIGNGARAQAGDDRLYAATPAFSLQPGERQTIDVALVFAQDDDRLDSVTELRAASDVVQAAYDDGVLAPAVRAVVQEEGPDAGLTLVVAPNPVPGHAVVSYSLSTPGVVRLAVVDVLGREVAVLVESDRAAGAHEARLDAGLLAPGVYVVVLRSEGRHAVRRLTVVR